MEVIQMTKRIEKIFSKIDFLKERAGYSDYDIAASVGITPSGYSRIKNQERKMSIDKLEKIAQFFNIPLLYFFFLEGDIESIAFDEILKQHLEEHNLTPEELAEQVDINSLRLRELTLGTTPTYNEAQKIMAVLHLELPEEPVTDGRILLLTKVLQDLNLDQSKIDVVLSYIDRN